MSEIKKAGRARTITLVILILMAIGMGYDQLKQRDQPPARHVGPAQSEG